MITLTNPFHNTEATVRAEPGEWLTKSQWKRAQQKLCGIDDCKCMWSDAAKDPTYRLESDGMGAVRILERRNYGIEF